MCDLRFADNAGRGVTGASSNWLCWLEAKAGIRSGGNLPAAIGITVHQAMLRVREEVPKARQIAVQRTAWRLQLKCDSTHIQLKSLETDAHGRDSQSD